MHEDIPWYEAYFPHLGISSVLHFGVLLAVFACMPRGGGPPAPDQMIIPIQALKPTEPPAQPEPEARKEAPPVAEAPSDIQDRDGVVKNASDQPESVPDLKLETTEAYSTDNGTAGPGALGDPNQINNLYAASLIDNFVDRGGMPSVKGRKGSTGQNAPYGPRIGLGGNQDRAVLIHNPNLTTQDAVRRALDWLKRHQAGDGRWQAGDGVADYDAGVSGLALLAFLGHGETTQNGHYQDTVHRALAWIKAQQAADGGIGPKSCEKHLYNHAIATMALAEAVGMGEYSLKDSAQKAVNYLVQCQNPGMGWRYRNYNLAGTPAEKDGNNDTSVTGWALMALKSARVAKLAVPDSAFQGGSAWLDEVYAAGSDYKATFGYARKDGFVYKTPHTTTSVGVLVRQLMEQSKGVDEGVATLMDQAPDWKAPNFYYWYYATLAIFQRGGEPWVQWNVALRDTLCKHQETAGDADGSWDPAQDRWGDAGGRVYTTAMGAMCLEVYYRYARNMRIHP